MKFVIALCLFALAFAAPQSSDGDTYSGILRSDFERNPDTGAFRYSFELSNGVKQEIETEPEPSDGTTIMRGFLYLPVGDGSLGKVEWVADAQGYHISSPKFPELPQFIGGQAAFAAAYPLPQNVSEFHGI